MDDLTPETLAEAAALLDLCNRRDETALPIFLDHLVPTGDARTALLHRDNGGTLTGIAAVPDAPQPEACLAVHPDHRRQGIGTALIRELRAELRRRGLTECLLVTDAASPSAGPFLEALAIPHHFTEYRLALEPAAIDRSRPRHDGLTLRPATGADADALVTVLMAAFGHGDAEARGRVEATFQERARRFYLAELDGMPIGAIRAGEWGGNGDITAFGVLPSHQGRGYGRQILLDTVDLLLAEGHERVLLEVAVDRVGALGLYRSCGFQVIAEFGYYGVESEHPLPLPSPRRNGGMGVGDLGD